MSFRSAEQIRRRCRDGVVRRRVSGGAQAVVNTIAALCPPKPNELFSTAGTGM